VVGASSYHLGANLLTYPDSTLAWVLSSCANMMLFTYETMFHKKIRNIPLVCVNASKLPLQMPTS
jgi:hypothetical protein